MLGKGPTTTPSTSSSTSFASFSYIVVHSSDRSVLLDISSITHIPINFGAKMAICVVIDLNIYAYHHHQ